MFQIIAGLFSIAFTLTKTALFIVFKLWKISLPVIGLLLLFKLGSFWGFLFLLPATVLILVQVRKLMKSKAPTAGSTPEVREVTKALTSSSHLQDFFAPLKEGFTDVNGFPKTAERKQAVSQAIVSATQVKAHGGADAVEVTFRIFGDTERFSSKVLPAVRNELAFDAVEPAKKASEEGGFFKVTVTPQRATEDFLLSQTFHADAVYEDIPMKERELMRIPLAMGEDGAYKNLSLHHSIISGVSGSGKGGPLQAMLQHFCTAPDGEQSFWERGLFNAYMIDPKSAEFSAFKNSVIPSPVEMPSGASFSVASASPEEMEAVVNAVHERLTARERIGRRSFVPSVNTPLIVLFWDEFSSSISTVSKEASQQLTAILSKGRSLGIFVVVASQEVNKSVLGSFRSHFANKLLLKLATAFDASTITQYPQEYLESLGVKPAEIEPSNPANGFRTSGLGWLMDDSGSFDRVRFFYCSDGAVSALAEATTPPELWNAEYKFAEGEVL